MSYNRSVVLGVLLCAFVLIGVSVSTVFADNLVFSQVNFNLDDNIYTDTEWGQLDFTFSGSSTIKYLNLKCNGSWQVQNVAVVSYMDVGADQTISYYFDLGSVRGTDVTSVVYDYAFTDEVLAAMPGGSNTGTVGNSAFEVWSGIDGGGTVTMLAAAGPIVGSEAVAGTVPYAHKDFPNQQCGKNECVPAAVSNSLQWLNRTKNLGMDDSQLTIAKAKTYTDWKASGCPIATWYTTKDTELKKLNLPISTRKETDMEKVVKELKEGKQDVEIIETWTDGEGKKRGHCTALVSIVKGKDGKYTLTVVDDTKQGDDTAGCDKPRTYIYDPATGKIFEPGWGFTTFEYAVVECPEPASLSMLALGALALVRRRRK